jgi:hypothetical protein
MGSVRPITESCQPPLIASAAMKPPMMRINTSSAQRTATLRPAKGLLWIATTRAATKIAPMRRQYTA